MRDRRMFLVAATFLAAIMLPAARLLTHVPGDVGDVQPAWAASSCGNAIVEPPEQCDPPGSITCAAGSPFGAFLPCNVDCICPMQPDHFQCYELKPSPFPIQRQVSVQDQFGPHTETVRFPHRLCAPAAKNDEPPNNAFNDPEHLIGHLVSGPAVKVAHQTLVNQFGTIVLDVVRPDILLVPTLKTLTPPPPPPLTTPAVDHFQCYKVKQ